MDYSGGNPAILKISGFKIWYHGMPSKVYGVKYCIRVWLIPSTSAIMDMSSMIFEIFS